MKSIKFHFYTWIFILLFIGFSGFSAISSSGIEIPADIPSDIRLEIEGLFSTDTLTRIKSAIRLGNCRTRAVPAAPFLIELLEDTVKARLQTGSPPTSPASEAKKALIKIGIPAEPFIAAALNHDNWIIRSSCAEILGDLKSHLAVDPLVKGMNDENPIVRKLSAKALGKIEPADLVQALKHKRTRIRASAAWALGELTIQTSVKQLHISLEDKNIVVKGYIIEALGKIKNTSSTHPLIKYLKHQKRIIREKAATALGQMGDPRAVEALIEALNHKDWATRWKAARAIGMINDKRGLEPLIRSLQDKRAEVRFAAAWSLGEIGDSRAVKYLFPLLRDGHITVRQKSEEALKKITGRNFGESDQK